MHLYSHNQSLYERLRSFIPHIAKLAMVNDVVLHDPSKIVELDKFVIKSTAGYQCSFGIETNHLYEADNGKSELNAKKLKKLETELESLLKRVSTKRFSESAPQEIQAKISAKVSECENQSIVLRDCQSFSSTDPQTENGNRKHETTSTPWLVKLKRLFRSVEEMQFITKVNSWKY